MKKNLIALMMSIVIVMGSIGGSSVIAAETTDESSTTESAVEETADEGIVVPEIADGESVALEEQEEASEVTEPEQTEDVQDDAANSEEMEDSAEAITDETVESEMEEPSFQEEEIIEADAQEKDEEDREAEAGSVTGDNVAQAIWTKGNTTFTFFYGPMVSEGDSFKGEIVTHVWSGTDVIGSTEDERDWYYYQEDDDSPLNATCVVFDSSFLAVKPRYTSSWFYGFKKLTSLDLSGLDTSNVTDMSSMFSDCQSLTSLDLSGFDTSNVTDMFGMFCNCWSLTSLDLSGFDTSNVINMHDMFHGCSSLTSLDLSDFDTSNVTYMTLMFAFCKSLKSLDLSGFDTSNVEHMDGMFGDCTCLTSLDLSGFDTSNVEMMSDMFSNCTSLKSLDLSGFDTSNVLWADEMFDNCSSLTTIYCADSTTNWRVGKELNIFRGCYALVGKDGATQVAYSDDSVDGSMAKSASLGGYFTPKGSSSVVDVAQAVWTKDNRTLIFYYGPQVSVGEEFNGEPVTEVWSGASVTDSGSDTPVWNATLSNVAVSVVFDTSFSAVRPKSLYRWFYGFHSLGRISFTGLDTSDVVNMKELFSSCNSLINVDLKGFDTSNVEDMSYMFDGCGSLKTIYCADSTTDWSKITLSDNMFRGCISLLGVDHAASIVYNEERTDGSMAKAAGLGGYFSCYYKNDEMAIGPYTPNDMYGFNNPRSRVDLNIYKEFYRESKAKELFDSKEDVDHGMCGGMVVSAMASLLRDTPRVSSYNVSSLYDLKKTSKEANAALKYIKYGQALYHSYPVQAALSENFGNLQGLYESVLDFANGNSDKPVFITIGVDKNIENTRHALWGLGISENTRASISIDVYDCNYPGEICKLYLKKTNDRITGWEYERTKKTFYTDSDVWTSGVNTDVGQLTFCTMFCDYFVERFNNRGADSYKASDDNLLIKFDEGRIQRAYDPIQYSDDLIPIYNTSANDDKNDDSVQFFWYKPSDQKFQLDNVPAGAKITFATDNDSVTVSAESDYSVSFLGKDRCEVVNIDSEDGDFTVSLYKPDENSDYAEQLTISGSGDSIEIDNRDETMHISGADSVYATLESGTEDEEGVLQDPTVTHDECLQNPENSSIDLSVSDEGVKIVNDTPAQLKDLRELTITGIENKIYTGKEITLDIVIKDGDYKLVENTDFAVDYLDNINTGRAGVIIKGEGRYTGNIGKTFYILPGKTTRGDMFNLANNVKVTWKEVPGARYYKVYREGVTDKKETRKDPVIVTTGLVGWDKDPGLTNGHAYRYKIVASLVGREFSDGDSPLSYSKLMYRLKTVVIRSAKNTAPGAVTIKYDKTTSGDSYVLQYSDNKDMKNAKTKVVLGASNTSYVLKGLKKGKTYYISIRVRKKVNGVDYYTTFGVPKKVTITK